MDTLAQMRVKLVAFDNSLKEEDIVVAIPFNLTLNGNDSLVEGIVCVTKDYMAIFENGKETRRIPVCDIDRIQHRNGIGCGFLDYVDNEGNLIPICRGDNKHLRVFALVSKRYNKYLDGYEFDYSYENDINSRCEKCGRLLSTESKVCAFCANKSGYVIRLIEVAKPFMPQIIFSVFLYLVLAAINLISPYLNKVLVDDYIKFDWAGEMGMDLSSLESIMPAVQGLLMVLLAILLTNILQRAISIFRTIIMVKTSNKLVVKLRNLMFEKIQEMSLAHQSKSSSGMLIGRVTGDTGIVNDFLINQMGTAIEQIVILIAVGIFLFVYDWKLALLILFPAPIVMVVTRIFRKKTWKMYHQQWRAGDKMTSVMNDIFQGIRVVKCFGTEEQEIARFDEASKRARERTLKNEKFYSIFNPCVSFAMSIGTYFMLYYSGCQIIDGKMTLGYMMMITSYINLVYGPLEWMAGIPQMLVRFTTALARMFELMDEKNDVADAPDAVDVDIKGKISFENASFGYTDIVEVLHNVSLNIRPGEMLGIVGRSGVGKSTLINLVMRLYDLDSGTLKIDGVDIKKISQESLRKQIGVVLQETFLFSGTIYDNIAYAKPNATYDEIITAAKLAGAHKFIMKLPNGYNTKVGERGYTLSGGERQRVSIARAVLHDPKILILDEATAALDTETEKQIQDSLQLLIKDRTTLAIAHRLSTLRNATRLLVLDHGRVAELGSHDELMKKKGIYYGLIMAQRQMSKMAK